MRMPLEDVRILDLSHALAGQNVGQNVGQHAGQRASGA